MLKTILVGVLAFWTMTAFAGQYKCTEWTKTRGVSCIYGGDSASVYERQCENPCYRLPRNRGGNWGPNCQKEKVCSKKNPSTFNGVCSQWERERSVTCRNPNTGDWESKWVRVCTVGLKQTWCSDEDPNNL